MSRRLSAITLAAGMLLAGVLLALHLDQEVEKRVLLEFNTSQHLIAQQAAGRLESYFAARAQDLRHLASLASVGHLEAKTIPADLQATFARLKQAYVKDIAVLDATRQVVYSTAGDPVGSDNASPDIDAWARQSANKERVRLVLEKSDRPVTSATGDGLNVSSPRVFLVTPLYRESRAGGAPGAGEAFAGMLLLTVDLQMLAEGTLALTSPNRLHPLRIWAMDEDGTLLVQSEHPEMVMESIRRRQETCNQCHVSFDYAENMLTTKQGTVEYQLRGQPSKVAAFVPMTFDGVSWIVVVNTPRDEVTSFIRANSIQTLGLLGLIGTAVGFTLVSMYRHSADANYRAIFDTANDAIFVHDVATGAILDVNRRVSEMYGYSREEALCLALEGLSAGVPPYTHNRARELMREAAAGTPQLFEWPAKDHAGRLFWVEVNLRRAVIGEHHRLLAIVRDISERKRAEEARRLQSAALYAAADAIVITDRAGVIEWVNPAFTQLTGYTAEEAAGNTTRDLVKSGKHDPAFYENFWETILAGRAWSGEMINRRKDHRLYTEQQTVTPILDASGAITHFVAIKKDMTERLQLEAQFRQAQKMESVGQLASGIAHDFNNLLTVINGMSDLLLEQVSADDPVHADVQEIRLAGERAATLTRQLLAFSRQQVLEPRVLNVKTVVAGVESLLRRLLGEDIDLVVVPTPDVENVKADPGQLEQVLTNLAVNARDAMPQGGQLTIEIRSVEIDGDYARQHSAAVPPGSYVRLVVSDCGVGMDEATRARIFEPFFTTKGPGKGTGLGLSTVYGIVKQSHGFIWVYSEVGQGTSFTILLPQVSEAVGAARPGSTLVSSSGTETILLVEDNAALLKIATRFLEPAGYTVLGAATGEEALGLLERHDGSVHLLLSDVVMPGMSGRQLAERLAPTRPGMKVLFVSGYTGDTIVRHGVLDAQVPFLNKPFTRAALLRKVREVLDSQL